MTVPPTAAAPARRRPAIVTIAVILVYIGGIASAALGILVLLSRYTVQRDAVLLVSLLGAGIILFALLSIAVASGISRSSRLSRMLVTIYVAIQFTLHTVTLITTDAWDWTLLVPMAVDVFIVIALWAPPGSRHFRSIAADGRAAAPPSLPAT